MVPAWLWTGIGGRDHACHRAWPSNVIHGLNGAKVPKVMMRGADLFPGDGYRRLSASKGVADTHEKGRPDLGVVYGVVGPSNAGAHV